MSGDQLDLDAIEARANAATAGPWRAMPNLSGVPNGVDLSLDPCVFAVVHSDAKPLNLAADTTFIAHARQDVPALVAEVRRLRALVPQPAPPGVVIVSWSGKRHMAQPGSKVQSDGSKRALCSEYTWGVEPDADGDVVYGIKEGKRADALPMCKSCTRSAGRD